MFVTAGEENMGDPVARLEMFRGDLEVQQRHFERLRDERTGVVPRGKFEVLVEGLRAMNREFPGLVNIPDDSMVFAGKSPEGDQFNVDTIILVIDSAMRRLDSYIARPEMVAASAVVDPLASLVYARRGAIDPVTGLAPRAEFDGDQQPFLDAAKNAVVPLACLMIDVDDFKHFNETYGHPQGDAVLRAAATCLLAAVRGKGRAYRYGGDEYVALLLNFSEEDARGVGERLRTDIERLKLEEIPESIGVTIGVAVASPAECEMAELLRRADEALLEAKEAGKRRTVVYSASTQLMPSTNVLPVVREEELVDLVEWLESSRPEVRRDAARDLANLAHRRRIFPLEGFRSAPRKLLKDSNTEVRMLALEALAAIITVEGTAASGYYSRALLEIAEGDRDLDVRARAVSTIGNSADPRFLARIYDWIGGLEQSVYSRVWPVAALNGFSGEMKRQVIHDLRQRIESCSSDTERARYVVALKTFRELSG